MPLISFFVRRFLTAAVARQAARILERRFKMSPGVASIAFMIITEVLARATEKTVPGTTAGKGKWFGRRG